MLLALNTPTFSSSQPKNSALHVLCALLVLTVAVACGNGGGDDGAKELAEKRKSMEDKLQRYKQSLTQSPDKYPSYRAKIKAVAAQCEEELPELQSQAKSLLSSAKAGYKKAAETEFGELKKRVDEGIKKLGGIKDSGTLEQTIQELEDALVGFPKAYMVFVADKHEELRRSLAAQKSVGHRAREVLTKAQRMRRFHRYKQAIGVLESFSLVARFRDSPFAAKMNSEIDKVKKEAEEWAKKKAEEDKIPWQTIFRQGGMLINFQINGSSAQVEDGVATVESEGEFATLITGDESWVDYILDIEFKIYRGGFSLGVRFDGDLNAENYDKLDLREGDYSALNWHRVRVHVSGNKAEVVSLASFDVAEASLKNDKGKFFIAVTGTDKIQLRTVRVKVLKPAQE